MVEDLCSLREGVDGGEDFCEDVDGRWLRLFCSTPEAERFRRFDMAEIRAQETTVRIPPPGTRIAHEPHDIDPEPPERTWLCDLNAEHDPLARCGAEFSSYKALAMHKRRAHNLGLFLSRAVSFNSCPNCMSTFASRFSAINHLIRSCTIGHCPRNRSAHSHIAHGGSTALQCRICHEWSTDTSSTFAPTFQTHDQSSRLSGAENTLLFALLMLTDGAAASTTGPGWQLAITTVAGAGSSVGPSNKKQRTDEQTNTDAAASQKPTGKGKGGKGKQRRPAMDDQVLASIARLTLQGAQQHRTWEASLLDTFLLPTSSQTATSMKQAGRAYHQEV